MTTTPISWDKYTDGFGIQGTGGARSGRAGGETTSHTSIWFTVTLRLWSLVWRCGVSLLRWGWQSLFRRVGTTLALASGDGTRKSNNLDMFRADPF
jgi:hypothetical protein